MTDDHLEFEKCWNSVQQVVQVVKGDEETMQSIERPLGTRHREAVHGFGQSVGLK